MKKEGGGGGPVWCFEEFLFVDWRGGERRGEEGCWVVWGVKWGRMTSPSQLKLNFVLSQGALNELVPDETLLSVRDEDQETPSISGRRVDRFREWVSI